MTPKEKAEDLYYYYLKIIVDDVINMKPCYATLTHKLAKVSALKCINEIRDLMNRMQNYEQALYWKEIKEEIDRL
jgi:hypothetical protein